MTHDGAFKRFAGTPGYIAAGPLVDAVNCAIALERPLLLKGEPGTGKTVLARHVAEGLGTPAETNLHDAAAEPARADVARNRDGQVGDAVVVEVARRQRFTEVVEGSGAVPVLRGFEQQLRALVAEADPGQLLRLRGKRCEQYREHARQYGTSHACEWQPDVSRHD